MTTESLPTTHTALLQVGRAILTHTKPELAVLLLPDFETALGHQVLHGYMTAQEAYMRMNWEVPHD